MHDDNSWLKRPILPRPPALPKFGPEMRALIGLDPSSLERDAISNVASSEPSDGAWNQDTNQDTYLEELASVSEVSAVRGTGRASRTGT